MERAFIAKAQRIVFYTTFFPSATVTKFYEPDVNIGLQGSIVRVGRHNDLKVPSFKKIVQIWQSLFSEIVASTIRRRNSAGSWASTDGPNLIATIRSVSCRGR